MKQNDSKSQWTPEQVLSTLPHRPQTGTSSPVPFFHILERLKTTKREGWRRFNINHGESISDHMYRMSILTMLAPPSISSKINIPHCTKMALIHDMAESLVGDITPVDNVLKSEKSRREEETMDYICQGLLGKVHGGLAGQDIRAIWQEYEDSKTLESKFVHDIDKVELILQMVEYERSQGGQVDLGEFSWVAKRILLPECKEWCNEILAERREYWKSIGKSPGGDILDELQEAQHANYYDGK
jgi:putative hydrolases of HD superfamily